MPGKDPSVSFEVNRQLLNERLGRYAKELNVAPAVFVRQQVGLLMRELAEASAPKSQEALQNQIEADVSKVYAPQPKKMLPLQHRQGHGYVWIMATPSVLVGVKDQNWHPDDSVEDLKAMFHRTAEAGIISGPKRIDLPAIRRRGGAQKVQELNRIVVKRAVLDAFTSWLKKRAGILGGSWAVAWNTVRPNGRTPAAYKFRHTQDGTARGTFIDGLGVPGKASFTLINHATGVERASQLAMVAAVLLHRANAMKIDVENLLRGAYTRSGFRRRN